MSIGTDLWQLRALALAIARETRQLIRSRIDGDFSYRFKDDGSFVTEIDLAVEALIRERLRAATPGFAILGEEQGGADEDGGYLWVIDPVDGTHSLRQHLPLFGTLLALRHRARSVLGLIDLPMLDRTYVAATGMGAQCNGRSIRIRDLGSADAVRHEIIGIGERSQFLRGRSVSVFDRIMRAHPSVRTYCDAFGHGLAVEGALGAMLDFDLKLWDVAATEVIVGEAGGDFVRLNDPARAHRYDVVFGKPSVVRWVIETIERR